MAAGLIKLINGLPITIQPYDQSVYYSTVLSANTPITLPSSGSFTSLTAADILVILNDTVVEEGLSRDFTLTSPGSPPYTQIEFNYSLPANSVVRFKQVIG